MKPIILVRLCVIPILILGLGSARSAFAHGDEPRLELSTDRLSPGAVLEIRGVDFEVEEAVALALIGSQVEFPLGTAIGNAAGNFVLSISLPADLVTGSYIIRATTDDHVVQSPQITIWGTAQLEGGEEGSREEEDGLLAPMPTFPPGASSTPLPQIVAEETFVSKASSNTALYAMLTGVLIIVLVGLGSLRKR
jgi:hypothetical protein